MSDVAGMDELDEVRITATTGYRQTSEDEEYMRQCCARIEALLRNRQELVQVVDRFLSPSVVDGEYQIAADTLRKAKELDNGQ